ncbi:hypothetical protein MMC29_003667 [Sticta canariensis]|nr:hypothetical protein [Sticta canariensis]
MENGNVEKCSQSLDSISKGSGTEKHLRSSERPIHEKNESHPLPQSETVPLTKWNRPRINVWRTLTAFLAFFIIGAHDGAYGALIPYLEIYYNKNHLLVSLIFIPASVGYIAASFLNSFIHVTFGRRGAAFLGPSLRLIAYIVISQECPFPGLVICFCVSAFGIALSDAAWNAWIGAMQNSNEVLGILHAFYGLGATLSPLFATTMITKGGLKWYTFYYLMVGLSIAELAAGGTAFWTETGKKYRADNLKTTGKTSGHTREALRNRVTWICCFFLLVYSGTEVALGGWVVQFMRVVRHATPFPAGMSATGYWLGLTVGRVALGFVTPRIGEKLAILIYIALAAAAHLIFWLVPNFFASAVAVAFVGFFLGPLFPASVVAATKVLPPHLHVGSIGFSAAFGMTGAAILPFAVGAVAQARGVFVLMPIVLSMLVLDGCIWCTLPSIQKGPDEDQDGQIDNATV